MGYKEIETSFPSASDEDFNFTRRLVETPGVTPDDVWIQVLSPCREDLIKRTVDSVKGARKSILHLYLATSECFRRIVFGFTEEQSIEVAVKCTKYARSITKDAPGNQTEWAYEFSPETFSDTSPEFVVRICEAVKAVWEPSESNPLIFNLPATVEMTTPNVYADQIEYFCTKMTEREKICVSLHTHNDRGCAVAAAELGQLGGADRVEGTLFGNGERSGNVCLVTLGCNLYTQGVNPKINFDPIDRFVELAEESNKISVSPRHPYSGRLVYSAFSGSHQDAIKKGFTKREENPQGRWQIPYLAMDPADLGRSYDPVIRINSQSGKGGAAWIIQRTLKLDLPRGLQQAFAKIVQRSAEERRRELMDREVKKLFEDAYLATSNQHYVLVDYNITADRSASPAPPQTGRALNTQNLRRYFDGVISVNDKEQHIKGVGNGPISSLANALHFIGIDLDVGDYKEHTLPNYNDGADEGRRGRGRESRAAAYVECFAPDSKRPIWGVGISADTVQASLIAMLSAASTVKFPLDSLLDAEPILTNVCTSTSHGARRCKRTFQNPSKIYLNRTKTQHSSSALK